MHWIWLYRKTVLPGTVPQATSTGHVEQLMECCLKNENLAIAFEIANLNRHKMLSRAADVLDAVHARQRPFVFVLGKN